MDLGIGLPNAVPGASGEQLLEWARRAERCGFSSLGTIDRILYDNYEPLTALAATAAVTERIGLCTAVVIGPPRANAVLLAKQALSVQALSGGRLTLGIALGAREDDYEASGVEYGERARIFESDLATIRETWDGGRVGPLGAGQPKLVVGGHAEVSFGRAARHGDGWIAGGSGPEEFAEMAGRARAAWRDAGNDGELRTMALGYYALGEDAEENARRDLTHYYAWLGEEIAGFIASGAATDPDQVRGYLAAYEDAGCDELILFPCTSDPDQVDLLAEAAGM